MSFLDRYFFNPTIWQKLIIFCLLPFSFLYMLIAVLNTFKFKKYRFNIPIISVGNISVGGNGKTPFCNALSNFLYDKFHDDIFIILRGYKRKSSGLVVVKYQNKILCDVLESGDEAMEHALFSKANVIVSENRINGIKKAIELGAKCVILDDGFNKFNIEKFDILLNFKIPYKYKFCLPSGAYRLPLNFIKRANLNLFEGKDYFRKSYVTNIKDDMILISAIAKPFRLLEFKKIVKECYFYNDHADFNESKIQKLLEKHNAKYILTTKKDYVKLNKYNFNLILIEEELLLNDEIKNNIYGYIKEFDVFN